MLVFHSLFSFRSLFCYEINLGDNNPDTGGMIGRVVPEIGEKEIRERFVYSYRLVYRIQNSMITIVAIIHGKRLIENVSERFE